MIKWNKYFNKIYCISLVDNINRRKILDNEFKRVGINIKSNYFKYKLTIKSPYYECMYNSERVLKYENTNNKLTQNVFNASFAHYEIMKEALALGYDRILILEDDVKFLSDINLLKQYLDEILYLTNVDVIMFDKFYDNINYPSRKKLSEIIKSNKISNNYATYVNDFLSAACYSVNKKSMQKYICLNEQFFSMADYILNDNLCEPRLKINDNYPLIKIFAIENLAIQNINIDKNNFFIPYYENMGLNLNNYY